MNQFVAMHTLYYSLRLFVGHEYTESLSRVLNLISDMSSSASWLTVQVKHLPFQYVITSEEVFNDNDFVSYSICGFAPFLSQVLVQKFNPIALVGVAGGALVITTDALISYK